MGLFKLEHSKLAYVTDFALYSLTVLGLLTYLIAYVPSGSELQVFGLVMLGLVGWTIIEYILHRFVLHGLRPFNRWHAEHHQRPNALICAPTILSGSLIVILIFVPALLATDVLRACALTLGVMAGYLSYAVTHHATHHWRSDNAWLKRRKRWHALHHANQPGYYGVTSGLWDYLLASKPHTQKSLQRADRFSHSKRPAAQTPGLK